MMIIIITVMIQRSISMMKYLLSHFENIALVNQTFQTYRNSKKKAYEDKMNTLTSNGQFTIVK